MILQELIEKLNKAPVSYLDKEVLIYTGGEPKQIQSVFQGINQDIILLSSYYNAPAFLSKEEE